MGRQRQSDTWEKRTVGDSKGKHTLDTVEGRKCMTELGKKKYCVIYADPPWQYTQCGKDKKGKGTASKHYKTMKTDDICNLPVKNMIEDTGSICFLWATLPNLKEALKVMEAWGFEYKTAAFVWVKKNMQSGKLYWGMGAYTRANAEICLLGISPRFSAKKFIKSHSVHQVIESPHEKHSKKPDAVRKKIDQLLGNVTKIELFARQRIDGWDAWGDEMTEEKGASDTSHET